MAQRTAFNPSTAAPPRAFGDRFASVILTLAAIALIVMGRVDPTMVDRVRSETADFVAPILTVIQQPLATVRDSLGITRGLFDLAKENARLRLMAEPDLADEIEKKVREAQPESRVPVPQGARLSPAGAENPLLKP